jgi:hypothetical protein
MTRPAPAPFSFEAAALARGAVALLLAPVVGGCMYLTPATGVCVTDACRSFDATRAAAAAAAAAATPAPQAQVYEAPDFKLTFPGVWGALSASTPEGPVPLIDQTESTGASTLRVGVGGLIQLEGDRSTSEGIRVITLNKGLDPGGDEQKSKDAMADITRRSIVQNFEGTPEIMEGSVSLAGKPAYQVSMVGTGKGLPVAMRHIARAVLHRGRGYIVMLSTVEARYAEAPAVYDGLFDGFELKDADPTYTLPTPGPSGSPTPGASGSPTPGPSGSPAPAASGSPAPSASPSGSASPAASPSPTGSPA